VIPDLPPVEYAEQALVEWVDKNCEAASVRVIHLGLAESAIANAELFWAGDPCKPRPELVLSVSRPQGLTRLKIRPLLEITVPVIVASQAAAPGDTVTWQSGTALLETLVAAPVSGGTWQARTAIAAGQALTEAVVHPPLAARRGDGVEIVFVTGPLRITASGHLMQNGRLGDTVQVANRATGVAQRGTLIAPDRVEIRP
jgi:flagella basal body P-ring formation protein FlgA